MDKLKIGVVSLTDPRAVKGIDEIDRMNIECQEKLAASLKKEGFEVIVPLKQGLVRSRAASIEAAEKMQAAGVQAMALGCWKWTDPMLAVEMVRRVDRPVCLVGENEAASTALGCMAAIGAALWEIAPNRSAMNHARVVGDHALVAQWARGAATLPWLKTKSLLLWGGSYCLKMSHLDDDPSRLKSFIIGDILVEDQYHLIAGAEKILAKEKNRVAGFIKWLEAGGTCIKYDKKMLTPEVLRRQAALYLAARDRLKELDGEDIAGVSIKCQPALSETWGVTGCMLPAFIPFGADSEGTRPALATTCEGDIKGLITSLMLQRFAGVPAGFGDIRNIDIDGRECLVVSNCGGASAYYAAMSGSPKKALPALNICGQCQGASGGAVGYSTPPFGEATLARLIRKQGRYTMQYMLGKSVEVSAATVKRLGWGSMWPITIFDIDMDLQRFAATVGSNHYSFVPGNFMQELICFCCELGMDVECLNG